MKKTLLCVMLAIALAATAEIPAGYYYKADGLEKEALKTALNDIVSYGRFLSYGGGAGYTWQGFYYTDRNEADSTVVDMYSNEKFKFTYTDNEPDFKAVEGMHIEHSLPKSWWGSVMYNAYKDLNHLFPAEGKINSAKNDLPLGIVGAATSDNGVSKVGVNTFRTNDYAGNCFEPADEYKGDFARAYFYVATAYEEFANIWNSPMIDNNTYPVWKDWALDLLLQWHRADPVSEKERNRQEQVYAIQGNRNPFIDYPDLVEYIWGNKTDKAFNLPADARAFLITPTRWDKYDFGVLIEGVAPTYSFVVEGVNINGSIKLALANGKNHFSISQTTISASDAMQGDARVAITFDASALGDFIDTIKISGGGLENSIEIPLRATVTDEFMALEPSDITATTATLNWMGVAGATDYVLDVYQGTDRASDLFFSYYVEGSSNNKAIALYNGTGQDIDLSKYTLKKQNNGLGSFHEDTTLTLTGTLQNGKTYVLVYVAADKELRQQADKIVGTYENGAPTQTILSFNGNDAIALYHSGIQIDIIGQKNDNSYWGQNMTLIRKPFVNGPTTQFTMNEWEQQPQDYFDNINTHTAVYGTKQYLIQNKSVGNITAYTLKKLAPNSYYFFRVTAAGKSTDNIMQWRTNDLSAPLALDAENIFSDEFEPAWETVPDADQQYLLTLYSIAGELTTIEEGFDDINALKDAGWQGKMETATGAQYVGTSTPAIALKNEGDTLVTAILEGNITKLSFMYRFYNKNAINESDTSTLTIDAFNGTAWDNIAVLRADGTTTKFYPEYTLDHTAGYSKIRWKYTRKLSGSVYLDDVKLVCGQQDTTYLLENEPWYEGWAVRSNVLADGKTIEPETQYGYRIRATVGDYLSDYSNEIVVTTLAAGNENPDPQPNIVPDPIEDHTNTINDHTLTIWGNHDGIGIAGANNNANLRIFSVGGQLIYARNNIGNTLFVPLKQHGIFVVQIRDAHETHLYKIAK